MRKCLSIGFSIVVMLLISISVSGQQKELAKNYMRNGEYEKAAEIYEELYDASGRSSHYLEKYIDCLNEMKKYEEAEKFLSKEIKKMPQKFQGHILLGQVYSNLGDSKASQKQYEKAIDAMTAQYNDVMRAGNAFVRAGLYDWAEKAYLKGIDAPDSRDGLKYGLADVYRRQGETPKMIEEYLSLLPTGENNRKRSFNLIKRFVSGPSLDTLKIILYEKIQESDDEEYLELLAWTFVQQENYGAALRQYKALDRRLNENGARIYNIAETASNAKDYDTAIEAYEYLISKGRDGTTYYLDAQQGLLFNKRKKITSDLNYTQADLLDLEQEYLDFLEEYGWNANSAGIISELADLEAFYLNDRMKAIDYLSQLIDMKSVNRFIRAKAKISLADFYLMDGEIWESTLLYSQVDKAFREELLGQEARFKNAKLSYYNGNFSWAQEQFDVLKASTSRMISNDAIDLSVFITDNLGLDSTAVPMEMYAQSDLLIFQNRYDEANDLLKEIESTFPGHKLEDDILYSRAQIHFKKKEYDEAISLYNRIVENHSDEIRADNALFNLAYIYEKVLQDPEKAKEIYEKIFLEYSDSTFAVEARKKYRQLRGDEI